METNKIYLGDCLEILDSKVDDGAVDLIFADPPYNLSGNGLKLIENRTGGAWHMVNEEWDRMNETEYLLFTENWVTKAIKKLKDSGSIYVSCTFHNIAEIVLNLKKNGIKINNIITWQKSNPMPSLTKRTFTHSTEFIIWGVKGKNWIFNYEELKNINPDKQINGEKKQMRDVWNIPIAQGKERLKGEDGRALHPTQKPLELLKRIIIASSNEGDVVLDPFLGSGTTAYVACLLNRRYIGIENNQIYFFAALKRLEELESNLFINKDK